MAKFQRLCINFADVFQVYCQFVENDGVWTVILGNSDTDNNDFGATSNNIDTYETPIGSPSLSTSDYFIGESCRLVMSAKVVKENEKEVRKYFTGVLW